MLTTVKKIGKKGKGGTRGNNNKSGTFCNEFFKRDIIYILKN